MSLYFNASELPDPTGEYVFWCDGMGTGGALSKSLSHASNFVFKLHRAFGEAADSVVGVKLYPLMDGMYVTSQSRDTIQTVIRRAYVELAKEFCDHKDVNKHFLVRGAVAYGTTLHGSDIPDSAFATGNARTRPANLKKFQQSQLNETRSNLLLSSVMGIAYRDESLAPPFGVYVNETAMSTPQLVDQHDNGFPSHLWFWWRNDRNATTVAKKLAPEIIKYFEQAEKRTKDINYSIDAIKRHRSSLPEYFGEFLKQKRSTMRKPNKKRGR